MKMQRCRPAAHFCARGGRAHLPFLARCGAPARAAGIARCLLAAAAMRGGASTVAAALGIEGVADADGGRRSGPAKGFYDAPRAPAVRVMPAIDDVAPNSDTSPPPYAAGFDGGIALTRSELSAAAAELGAAVRAIVTPSSSHVETRSGRTGLPAAEDMLRPGSPPVIAFAMRNGVELVAGMLAA